MLISIRHGFIARPSRILSLTDYNVQKQPKNWFPCGRSRCNTCAHTNASPTINTLGRCITINSKYTCISHNVVYVIKCRTCNKMYIGETGRRLGDRFREHLHPTRQTNTDLPVVWHFASPRHAYTDMLMSAIHCGFRDGQDRCRFEAKMTVTSRRIIVMSRAQFTVAFYHWSRATDEDAAASKRMVFYIFSAQKWKFIFFI